MRMIATLALLLITVNPLGAQSPLPPATPRDSVVTIVPGAHFRAGFLHRLVLGAHHRDLWGMPIEATVLDMSTYAGGLTPLKQGGGKQTRSLRLRSADGRTLVFRSIDKDPAKALSPELRHSVAARVLDDQMSMIFPFAGLAVTPLLEAADVLHAQPTIAIMPDDERLGEFRADFGGVLGIIEERPEASDSIGFAGSIDVISSEKLEQKLEAGARDHVDAPAFLTARLLDILIGDVDRHPDQWRWAGFPADSRVVWRPIPRDRDFAFMRLNGIAPSAVRYRIPQFVSFGDEYPDIWRLTWSGRALDRRLLTGLSWPTWASVATRLAARITDERIDAAMQRLPLAYQQTSGTALRTALRQRRDKLPEVARAYYELLAEYADVHATDGVDTVLVRRTADQRVQVRIGSIGFARDFDAAETREIRIYAHGGDDYVSVDPDPGITVRVIGGGGDDTLSGGDGTSLYDDRGTNTFHGSAYHDTRKYTAPEVVSHGAPARDWGSLWIPSPTLAFDSDQGLYSGITVTRFGYGFRRFPYASKLTLHAGYATTPERFKGRLVAELSTRNPAVGFELQLHGSGAEFNRFYGFGNETSAEESDDFYRIRSTEYAVSARARVRSRQLTLSAGPIFKGIDSDGGTLSLIASQPPYGAGRHREIGVVGMAHVERRNRVHNATSGFYATVDAGWYPSLLDVVSPFGGARIEAATYVTPLPTMPVTLALRGIGDKAWGKVPFRDAAVLGGSATLRGFREQRFAGTASLLGNAELRVKLADIFVLLPEQIGVHAVGDAGRVYVSGESSHRWHSAFGGGVWLSIVNPATVLSATFVRSSERSSLYIQNGFQF